MSEPTPAAATGAGDDLLAALADDFLRRHRAGERPSVEAYASRHPELARRVRDLFPTMLAMEVEPAPPTERAGATIGRYKLLERIGEGGFGTVFMAEQQHPVRRRVALKVIKPGVDTRQVIARFEAERQALALMEHENIARVLDAGATESGRPYFVMELVHGVPITTFCDENQLPPHERLALFARVCRAVQHAHTKGVIHRDIKPTNVLVTLHEGVPVPKVIDFGVAKATGQELTDKTLFTQFAQMVGTPLYMSPEQAEMTGADVDTRSDVYSLGVLLYELLTGTTPLDKDRLKQAAFDEVRRIIREEEPPRPSTRLSTMGEQARSVSAARRKSDPRRLGQLVRGELDWIVMKALEKDRARRYETANGLARDVERYLADEPVQACPASATYRLRKFVRRHQGPVVAGAVVLLTLVGGIVGTTAGLLRAEQARRAASARAEGERQAKQEAHKRLAQVERGAEVLASVFRDVDPKAEEKEGVTLRVLLGQRLGDALRQLDGETGGDPLVVARLQHLLGVSLRELGHLQQAEAALTRARQTRERVLPPDHLDTAATKHNLAQLYRARGKYAEAEALYRDVLRVRTAQLGPDDDDTLGTKNNLALVYMSQGKNTAAEPLLREVLAVRTARLGPDDLKTLQSKHNLAGIYMQDEGKQAEAESLLKEVLDGRSRKLRPGHPDTLQTKNNLAFVLDKQNRYDEAETLLREVVDVSTAELGPGHRMTLGSKHNLAGVYGNHGKHDAAAVLLKEVLEAQLANPAIGPRHHDTLNTKRTLAALYGNMQEFDLAIPLHEETLELSRAILGPNHPDTLRAQANFGIDYVNAERFAEAITLLEDVQRNGGKAPNRAEAASALVRAYARAGKTAEATAFATEQVRAAREQHPADSRQLAAVLAQTGKALLDVKLYADAEPLLRENVSLWEKRAPSAWEAHMARSLLGGALLGQQKYREAEPLLLNGYAGLKQTSAQVPAQQLKSDRLRDAVEWLVQLYDAWGKPDEATKWRQELAPAPAPGAPPPQPQQPKNP